MTGRVTILLAVAVLVVAELVLIVSEGVALVVNVRGYEELFGKVLHSSHQFAVHQICLLRINIIPLHIKFRKHVIYMFTYPIFYAIIIICNTHIL